MPMIHQTVREGLGKNVNSEAIQRACRMHDFESITGKRSTSTQESAQCSFFSLQASSCCCSNLVFDNDRQVLRRLDVLAVADAVSSAAFVCCGVYPCFKTEAVPQPELHIDDID
jgi:hypothetical protein